MDDRFATIQELNSDRSETEREIRELRKRVESQESRLWLLELDYRFTLNMAGMFIFFGTILIVILKRTGS